MEEQNGGGVQASKIDRLQYTPSGANRPQRRLEDAVACTEMWSGDAHGCLEAVSSEPPRKLPSINPRKIKSRPVSLLVRKGKTNTDRCQSMPLAERRLTPTTMHMLKALLYVCSSCRGLPRWPRNRRGKCFSCHRVASSPCTGSFREGVPRSISLHSPLSHAAHLARFPHLFSMDILCTQHRRKTGDHVVVPSSSTLPVQQVRSSDGFSRERAVATLA